MSVVLNIYMGRNMSEWTFCSLYLIIASYFYIIYALYLNYHFIMPVLIFNRG